MADEAQTAFAAEGECRDRALRVEPDLDHVAKSIAAGLRSGRAGKAAIMDAQGDIAVGGTTRQSGRRGRRASRARAPGRGPRPACWPHRRDHPRGCRPGRARRGSGDVRGLVRCSAPSLRDLATQQPAPELASTVAEQASRRGLLLLKAGSPFEPPLVLCRCASRPGARGSTWTRGRGARSAFSRSRFGGFLVLPSRPGAHRPPPGTVPGDLDRRTLRAQEVVDGRNVDRLPRARPARSSETSRSRCSTRITPGDDGVRGALPPGGPLGGTDSRTRTSSR